MTSFTMTLTGDRGESSMFERYTDRARRVLVLAQDEARDLKHGEIGTDHLLLGLVGEGGGVAFLALDALGVTLEMAMSAVMKIHPAGLDGGLAGGNLPFNRPAKKVFEYALREAIELGHNYIATEHLLLGLIREGQGNGWLALADAGTTLGDRGFPVNVREKVLELLRGYAKQEGVQRVREDRANPDLLSLPWRTGRSVYRTIYAQAGGEASRDDELIGVMDSPELAAEACEAHNALLEARQL